MPPAIIPSERGANSVDPNLTKLDKHREAISIDHSEKAREMKTAGQIGKALRRQRQCLLPNNTNLTFKIVCVRDRALVVILWQFRPLDPNTGLVEFMNN